MKICYLSALSRIFALGMMLYATTLPAFACFMPVPIEFRDILEADVVIEGYVIRYEFALTENARRSKESLLASIKAKNEDSRWEKLVKENFFSYALLTIRVERVLVGTVSEEVTVTWESSFQMPKTLDASLQTFAFRDPRKGAPTLPLRSASGVIWRTSEPDKLTLLQAPCSDEFMFSADGERGRAIAKIFDGVGDPAEKMELYLRPQPSGKFAKAPAPPPPSPPADESGHRITGMVR